MIRLSSILLLTVLLTSPAFGQQQQGTLQKIKAKQSITLGYRESSFPFSFIGEDWPSCPRNGCL
jgi:hypothetical protein